MKNYLKKCILVCVCTLMLGTAYSETDPIQSLSFTTLSWGRMIDDVYYRNADGEAVKLWITNGAPSSNYKYRGTYPVRFFEIDGVDEAGKPIESTVATYTPASTQDQLLIFLRNTENAAQKYRVLPLAFDPQSISDNTYRFINLSSFPVYLKFGEERFKLDIRGERSLVSEIPDTGGQGVAMAIQVSDTPDDVKIAYSSSWSMRAGRSSLVFITTRPGDEAQIQVKKLYF